MFVLFLIILQTVFYPAISLKSLSLWNCTQVGDDLFLTADVSLRCSGSQYTSATVFNIMFVVGVVVGWPAFLIWYLRRVRERGRMHEATVLNRVGFLFEQVRFRRPESVTAGDVCIVVSVT